MLIKKEIEGNKQEYFQQACDDERLGTSEKAVLLLLIGMRVKDDGSCPSLRKYLDSSSTMTKNALDNLEKAGYIRTGEADGSVELKFPENADGR